MCALKLGHRGVEQVPGDDRAEGRQMAGLEEGNTKQVRQTVLALAGVKNILLSRSQDQGARSVTTRDETTNWQRVEGEIGL